MDDAMILDLYFNRSEAAIAETARKYGNYCLTVAANILGNRQDTEECVNDTYLKAWEAIPPEHPTEFKAYLGKITRNLALNKYKAAGAKKRGGGFSAVTYEFEQCFSSSFNVESEFDMRETGYRIDSFLRGIEKENRVIFIRRYWYGDSVKQISERLNISQSKVKSSLFRTRNKLRAALESEGIL